MVIKILFLGFHNLLVMKMKFLIEEAGVYESKEEATKGEQVLQRIEEVISAHLKQIVCYSCFLELF